MESGMLFGERNIEHLPENILLDILFYLPVKDLLTAARVCRKWRRVSNDRTLWKNVDLSSYKFTLQRLRSLIRAHFSDSLLSLQLKGFLEPNIVTSWKKHSLSDVVLQEVNERAPNLRNLSLTHMNLTGISIDAVPNSVESLSILHSLIPNQWFSPLLSNQTVIPNLLLLDLSFCGKTSDFTVECVAKSRPRLTSLRLNGCYLVSSQGLKTAAENLKQLTVLEVSGTKCDDLAVHHIGRCLPQLKALDLSFCKLVSDGSLATIASTLRKLESLNLRGCGQLTDAGFSSILNCSSTMTKLDVAETIIDDETISKFKVTLPQCAVFS